MSAHEAWMGLTVDHLYPDCPSRTRGEMRLRAWGWWQKCSDLVDPLGTDICGLCLHRWKRTEAVAS